MPCLGLGHHVRAKEGDAPGYEDITNSYCARMPASDISVFSTAALAIGSMWIQWALMGLTTQLPLL